MAKKNGAAATAVPFPDGFVTEMVFHFAYKMFEGYTGIHLLQRFIEF